MEVSGLRSQVSVSGLRSLVSGLRSQVSGLRSQVSGLGSIVSVLLFFVPVPISIGFPFETLHPINVSSTYTYIYIYIYIYMAVSRLLCDPNGAPRKLAHKLSNLQQKCK